MAVIIILVVTVIIVIIIPNCDFDYYLSCDCDNCDYAYQCGETSRPVWPWPWTDLFQTKLANSEKVSQSERNLGN